MISPGTMLGQRYRLEERIASGGMGDVWRCVDDVLGRTVAVKILLPSLLEEPGFTERFRGEARTMATINHPGVVDIYDYGSDPATGAYLVMEFVEGEALSRTLARVGRLTPGRTMALVAQAADALHAAHQTGVVHRDVKPGNLLVRPNGTLVLTDFGIARSAGAAQLTAAGSVLGTASYISPEQAMGEQASAAVGCVRARRGRLPVPGRPPTVRGRATARDRDAACPRGTAATAGRHSAVGPGDRGAGDGQAARGALAQCGSVRAGRPPGRGRAGRDQPAGARDTGGGAARPNGPAPVPTGAPAPGTRVLASPPPNRGGAAGAVPAGYLRGQPVPGYLQTPVPQPRRGMSAGTVVAIIVAVVLVAVCIGAGLAFLRQANKTQNQTLGVPSTVAAPPSSAGGTNSEGRFGQ